MNETEQQLHGNIQRLIEAEDKKKHLSLPQIKTLIQRHKADILPVFDYDLTNKDEYWSHWQLLMQIANNRLSGEFRAFETDGYNSKVIQFLLYYFNGCRYAEKVFPDEDYKIHKNLLLVGTPGTGKTLLMQIFSDYLKLTCNEGQFYNLSVTQMMNYYKVNGHIDLYTYNENSSKGFNPRPLNICLNDIGLETENQKSYGTSLDTVIDEFLYARYEIYQQFDKRYHITSNLQVEDFKERFANRLVDRFKSFNVIPLLGNSRRK